MSVCHLNHNKAKLRATPDSGYYPTLEPSLFTGAISVSDPDCPECSGEYTYVDGNNYVCPECAHEWPVASDIESENTVKDSNGNSLADGDFVTVIKDLKIKGSSSVIKVGTKIKCGRIDSEARDHEIDCKVPGVGAMKITAKFTRKVHNPADSQ